VQALIVKMEAPAMQPLQNVNVRLDGEERAAKRLKLMNAATVHRGVMAECVRIVQRPMRQENVQEGTHAIARMLISMETNAKTVSTIVMKM
jgi:hypothetical protein